MPDDYPDNCPTTPNRAQADFDDDGIARVNVAPGSSLSTAALRVDGLGRMTVVGAAAPNAFSGGQVAIVRVWM